MESIPLPNTVVEALSAVPKQVCVSHSVKLDEEGKKGRETGSGPVLTSKNHAFYIGKLIPETKGGKVKRVLGWGKSEERIYNPEFIKGSLEYLLAHTKEGEKARIVVCRSVSEIINGSEDVEEAISTEDEIGLIKLVAKQEFSKSDKELEVVDLETLPNHKQLFETLRRAKSGDRADIEKVLSGESQEAVAETSSLHIARQLFKAMSESEELVERFKNAMPARLEEDEESAGRYYALVEVAIRLGDILNGCYIHGGAERQAIYDGIIIQILKGENGKYKDIEALKPFFPTLKGHRFETLHLDDKKNYHHLKKVQSTARYRLLVWAALAASAVGGIFGAGRLYERKESAKRDALVQKKVKDDLDGVTFRFDSKWEVPKEKNSNVFVSVMRSAKTHLMSRYGVSEELYEKLEPFFKAFMLKELGSSPSMHDENFMLIDAIDQFILDNEIFFRQNGIEIDMPYKKLWEKIKSSGAELSDQDIIEDDSYSTMQERGVQVRAIERLGEFYSGASFNDHFEFATVRYGRDNKKYLVARDFTYEHATYTSKQARLGLWQMEYAFKKASIVPLRSKLSDILNSRDPSLSYLKACKKETYPNSAEIKGALHGVTYNLHGSSTPKTVIFPLALDREDGYSCVLAANPGDKEFSYESGTEVAKEVSDIYDGLLSHNHNDMSGK